MNYNHFTLKLNPETEVNLRIQKDIHVIIA